MKLKRTIMSMLGALAVAAGFSLFAAPAAQAATPYFNTCTRANSGNTNWPYSHGAYYCPGVTVQKHNGQRGVLYDLSAKAAALYNKLKDAPPIVAGNPNGAEFYMMVDKQQYINVYTTKFGHAPAVVPSDTAAAFTAYTAGSGGTLIPLYTVVFVQSKNAQGQVQTNTYYQNATIHEAGHWADYYLRVEAGSATRASSTTLFQNLLNTDWSLFNDSVNNPMPACSTSVPDVFGGYRDPAGTYFCNGTNGKGGALQAPYSGLTNEQVLKAPTSFDEIFGFNNEIFAEETPVLTGNTDGTNQGLDQYFTAGPGPNVGRFACSKLYVEKLIRLGRLPTQQELINKACPTQ